MKTTGVMILVINTGSTSTKLAVFKDKAQMFEESMEHTRQQLDGYDSVLDQTDMRTKAVLDFIAREGLKPTDFDAIASRGGAFGVFKGGGYAIDDAILELASVARPDFPATASWLAALIAGKLSKEYGIPAYFYNAVRTDELCDYARYSGLSLIRRKAGAHPLNTKEVGRRVAEQSGRKYDECNFLICHMGGGISVEMHRKGKMIDKVCSEEGALTPERAGNIPNDSLVELCFSGEYTQKQIKTWLRGKGGLIDYLGTSSVPEVVERIKAGDKQAEEVLGVMAYMVAKDIGAMATTADGEIDNIIFTGGIAHSDYFTGLVRRHVDWIAPIVMVPGSFELEALAHGILRIYHGEENARHYQPGE